MTRLFFRFYIGVLVVLFLAWYLQGIVLKQRTEADRARVYTEAHGGGARLVARELDTANSTEAREQILADLQQRFDYRLHIVSVSKLPEETRHQLSVGNDVARFGDSVVATLSGGNEVVRLGPFPNYSAQKIKESLAGWMRLTREKLEAVASVERPRVLTELQKQFDVEVKIALLETLPDDKQSDMRASMHNIAWYRLDGYEGWFSGLPLSNGENFLRFGPFPSFEDNSQTAAATACIIGSGPQQKTRSGGVSPSIDCFRRSVTNPWWPAVPSSVAIRRSSPGSVNSGIPAR